MRIKNRGMMLESIINKTIKFYSKNEIALFHKKELNISFSHIKEEQGKLKINNGRIKTKSTADYYGIHNGKFIAFEAKSTLLTSLPIVNIKEHQINYLDKIITHGGISFFIVCFQKYDEYFIIKPNIIRNLDRKSLSIDTARNEGIKMEFIFPGILDFLKLI